MVENFRTRRDEADGLSYEDLKRVNPKITCADPMAGQTGPFLAARPRSTGQSYAGVTDGLGRRISAPSMTTMAIGDVSTGVASAMAVGFAIIHRDRTGKGSI